MKFPRLITATLFITAHALATSALASDPHVHGLSDVGITIEGNNLAIEVQSPAMNLVQFEHSARTQEEINSVEQAALILNKPDVVFSLSGGVCKLNSKVVDISDLIDTHKHDEEHEEHATKEQDHREITATYRYTCDNIEELSSIKVELFSFFSSIEEVRTIWITDTEQRMVLMDRSNNIIKL